MVYWSLLCMALYIRRPFRITIITNIPQWMPSVILFDDFYFLLNKVYDRTSVHCYPEEIITHWYTTRKRQGDGGSVMVLSMFCWESCLLCLYLNIIENQIYITIGTVSQNRSDTFQTDSVPYHLARVVWEQFLELKKKS